MFFFLSQHFSYLNKFSVVLSLPPFAFMTITIAIYKVPGNLLMPILFRLFLARNFWPFWLIAVSVAAGVAASSHASPLCITIRHWQNKLCLLICFCFCFLLLLLSFATVIRLSTFTLPLKISYCLSCSLSLSHTFCVSVFVISFAFTLALSHALTLSFATLSWFLACVLRVAEKNKCLS